MHLISVCVVVLLFFVGIVKAADLYVSPAGSDANPGTKEQPLATLATAVEKVRPLTGKEVVTLHFAAGIYFLLETVTFTPHDSGSEMYPVLYQAQKEGGAVLSGGSTLDLQWKPCREGIFQAKTAAQMDLSHLPEGYGFQFEIKLSDTTENESKPILDKVSVTFKE